MASHGWWCNSKTIPTTCPFCGERVFFFSCDHGSRVYFDELGDWEIHSCFVDFSGVIPRPPAPSPIPLKRKSALKKPPLSGKQQGKVLGIRSLSRKQFQDQLLLRAIPSYATNLLYYEVVLTETGESLIVESNLDFDRFFETYVNKSVNFKVTRLSTSNGQTFWFVSLNKIRK